MAVWRVSVRRVIVRRVIVRRVIVRRVRMCIAPAATVIAVRAEGTAVVLRARPSIVAITINCVLARVAARLGSDADDEAHEERGAPRKH